MESNHQTLNDELERIKFQHEIKVLEFEHEISRLKLENKKLKGEDKNKKYVELEKEIFLLKKRLESLAAENTILLQKQEPTKDGAFWEAENEQNQIQIVQLEGNKDRTKDKVKDLKRKQNQTQITRNKVPKLIPIKERLIEQGIARFIEGIEPGPGTEIYDSYVQWYNDITERMKLRFVYEYNGYFFIRIFFSLHYEDEPERIFSYKSCENKKNKNDFDTDFTTRTLDRGWTPENIKCVLILHPEKAQEFAELSHIYVGDDMQIDENGNFKLFYWESKKIDEYSFSKELNNAETQELLLNIDCTKHWRSMILCGIKH